MAKVCVVFGASRGIGKYIALAFAARGWSLLLCARTVEERDEHTHGICKGTSRLPGSLEETRITCLKAGANRVELFQADLKDPSSCTTAVDHCVANFGKVDVVVNAAIYKGTADLQRITNVEMGDLQEVIQCNFLSPVAFFKRALEHNIALGKENQICLIQLSSSSINMEPKRAVNDGGWDFAYVSSKSAISKLMGILRLETRSQFPLWRFFNVEPGLVITEIMKAKGLDKIYAEGFGSVPPEVSGEVCYYLATCSEEEANRWNGRSIYAPKFCEKLQLLDGYSELLPASKNSYL